jgi:hypothetical protein
MKGSWLRRMRGIEVAQWYGLTFDDPVVESVTEDWDREPPLFAYRISQRVRDSRLNEAYKMKHGTDIPQAVKLAVAAE